MMLFLFTLLVSSFSANASSFQSIDCKADDLVWKQQIHLSNSSGLSAILTKNLNGSSSETVLLSLEKVCARPMNFNQNCIVTDNSQPGFVSLSVECYRDKNPQGSWLATFDLSFYESSGTGISHCSGAAIPAESFDLQECVKN